MLKENGIITTFALMLMRLLVIALITMIAMSLGSYIGSVMSYWFMPDIMRMYLSWSEYLQQLPNQLFAGDPIGVAQRLAYSHIIGALTTTALALFAYFRLTNRKP